MNKPWIAFLFVAWTGALLALSPLLFSFTRTTTSFVEIKVTDGLPPIVMQVTTKHPWLDWTGRMARQSTEYTKETLQAYELRSDGSLQPKSDAGRNAVASIEDDRADIRPSAAPR